MSTEGPTLILDDFLFLGDGLDGVSYQKLKALDIEIILNLSGDPAPENILNNFECHAFQIKDHPNQDISPLLKPCIEHIALAQSHKKKILIHCQEGKSRSATIVLAFLISSSHMTLYNACIFLHKRRPMVCPNNGFMRTLVDFEKDVLTSGSVDAVCHDLEDDWGWAFNDIVKHYYSKG